MWPRSTVRRDGAQRDATSSTGRAASLGLAAALAAVATASGCAEERPREETMSCAAWTEEVAPVVAERCGGCHGGAAPAGGYDLSSYLGALGGGSDAVPNAAAGDGESALLARLEQAGGDDV